MTDSLDDNGISEDSPTPFLDLASIRFFRSIKEHHSRETVVDVMDALKPLLGKEWAGRVLFTFLSGNVRPEGLEIICQNHATVGPPYKKIQTIKIIRSLTGWSLTDAKRFVEDAETRPMILEIKKFATAPDQFGPRSLNHAINMLRESGCLVNLA